MYPLLIVRLLSYTVWKKFKYFKEDCIPVDDCEITQLYFQKKFQKCFKEDCNSKG